MLTDKCVNVEAEILGLKLRPRALEAQARPGTVAVAIAIAAALVTTAVAGARTEITQDQGAPEWGQGRLRLPLGVRTSVAAQGCVLLGTHVSRLRR